MANPETGATTVDGAGDRISALFNSEPKEPTDVDGGETKVLREVTETPEGDPEEIEQKYKVKVGDGEQEVTIEDLRKGYMMESDYRKKTSEVSERRKAVEVKEAEIDTSLVEAKSLIESEIENLQSAEMQALKEDDPDTYIKEFDRIQGKITKYNSLEASRNETKAEQYKALAKKELEALEIAIPGWIDPEVRNQEWKEVFAHLESTGYSRQELKELIDHRVIASAHSAMKLARMDLDSKEVKTPPKPPQPGVSKSKETRAAGEAKDLKSNLRKSGSMQDAQALFKTLLE
jgi:hypothetical protein